MEFSWEWKSLWPISSVFPAPLLISGHSAKPLGPLFFSPVVPQQLQSHVFFSSPSLAPPTTPLHLPNLRDSLLAFFRSSHSPFVPTSILNTIAFDSLVQTSDLDTTNYTYHNNSLHLFPCCQCGAPLKFVLFFPTGDNANNIGWIVLSAPEISSSKEKLKVCTDGGDVFKTTLSQSHRIFKISTISFEDEVFSSIALDGFKGFLLACNLYSVQWFGIKFTNANDSKEPNSHPVLVYLATSNFKHRVVHACWNQHLPEESVVLLENGDLFLFNLSPCLSLPRLPLNMQGTRIKVLINKFNTSGAGGWLSCEFSWHPRILVVVGVSFILSVDFRQCGGSNVNVLSNIEMIYSFREQSIESTDKFITFYKADFDDFYFSVATQKLLLLFDIRQPLNPILRWEHGLENPQYIKMFRLIELRPFLDDVNEFKWASENGFAIVLGSFENSQFTLFCYGPTPVTDRNKFNNAFCAWELPSRLSLSGHQCFCDDYILRDEFTMSSFPADVHYQRMRKREIMLGFCILPRTFSNREDGSFTLIRLMSSGKLEFQKFSAIWKCNGIHVDQKEQDLCIQLVNCDEKISKQSVYMNLGYLTAYINDNLTNILNERISKSLEQSREEDDHIRKEHHAKYSKESLCNLLMEAHIRLPSLCSTINVLSNIKYPTSLYEIASSKIWLSLPLDLLMLSFLKYDDIQRGKKTLEFLDIPCPPFVQLPPFFLRKPSSRAEKQSSKIFVADKLVGPVLPLPIMYTFSHMRTMKKIENLGCDISSFSRELGSQCNDIIETLDLVLNGTYSTVSLADDNELNDSPSQGVRNAEKIILYEPVACLSIPAKRTELNHDLNEVPNWMDQTSPSPTCMKSRNSLRDKTFSTFLSEMFNDVQLNIGKEASGLEFFDDLSLVSLNFESQMMSFQSEELEIYTRLKRNFSNWQEGFQPYCDFCTKHKTSKGP